MKNIGRLHSVTLPPLRSTLRHFPPPSTTSRVSEPPIRAYGAALAAPPRPAAGGVLAGHRADPGGGGTVVGRRWSVVGRVVEGGGAQRGGAGRLTRKFEPGPKPRRSYCDTTT